MFDEIKAQLKKSNDIIKEIGEKDKEIERYTIKIKLLQEINKMEWFEEKSKIVDIIDSL